MANACASPTAHWALIWTASVSCRTRRAWHEPARTCPKSILGDLSVKETCRELQVSTSTVWRSLDSGDLTGYSTGRVTRIDRSSIDAFKARNRNQPKKASDAA
ncbi:helix-turn-helix domain-containing protein [Ruegeria sp. THAF57]|uniref:helix-turn-helix domain-containing protein n=1 Tax=Ruegeria sp. THAF57 TaxID=2744555 RepID=UPI00210329FA|nr:helix-turn-helix domain-containing protein [Ruegeria sp. THAF57]